MKIVWAKCLPLKCFESTILAPNSNPLFLHPLVFADDTEEDDDDDIAPPLPPRRSESLLKSPLYNNGTQEQEIPTVLTASLIEDLALQGMYGF